MLMLLRSASLDKPVYSPSWEASSRSASQEIIRVSLDQKGQCFRFS